MMKSFLFFAIVFLCIRCVPPRNLFPQERFLAVKPGQDKIIFASVIPSEGDSSGTYLSTLIVHQTGGQTTASVERLTPEPRRYTRRDYTAQQLYYTDSTTLPAGIYTDTLTPRAQRFHLELNRTRFSFYHGATTYGHYAPIITYKEQTPFQVQPPRTDLRIGGIEPLEATFKRIYDARVERMNGEKLKSPSILFYHTLDIVDLLEPGKNYYWIDFYKYSEDSGYSVFFERDASGATKVIYSTMPAGEQLSVQLFYTVDNASVLLMGFESLVSQEKLMILPMDKNPLPLNPGQHNVETIIVSENNTPVGAGILYQLGTL